MSTCSSCMHPPALTRTNATINLLNLLYPHTNVTCLHVDAVVFWLRNGRKSYKNSFVDTPFLQDRLLQNDFV